MLRRLLNKRRMHKIRRSFAARAVCADNTTLLPGASCRNTGSASSIRIDGHCTIGAEFIALHGGRITVGQNTYIGPSTSIQAKQDIRIGNNVIIANNVILVDNNNHPTDPAMRLQMSACADYMHDPLWSWEPADSAPIVIEDNVWIGRDSRILKGVTVGKGSIVALGAIVTKDVPPYSLVAGNPARVVKQLTPPEETV